MLKLFNFRGRNQDKYSSPPVKDQENDQSNESLVGSDDVDIPQQAPEILSQKDIAAIKIQSICRRYIAVERVRKRTERVWERVFDPRAKRYFWFNKMNGSSHWNVPRLLRLHTEIDHAAVRLIQKIVRGFVGRMRARKHSHVKYVRFFDANQNKFYWMIKDNKETFWEASNWLRRQDIPLPPEDAMMYKSYLRIQELENKLLEKEKEIKMVRLQRFEELEPDVIKDRVTNAKAIVRSKHMETWTTDQLAAWFTELKMDEHIPFIYQNRVDGNLFVNLDEDEYMDMGIENRFHLRKLAIIMKAYKKRYEMGKSSHVGGDDDELISEYAPSELSDIIAHEGFERDEDDEDDEDDNDNAGGDGDDIVLTAEERLNRENEERNVYVEKLVEGDEENFPMVGDVVRVRYTCVLADGRMVSSTKAGMQLPAIEFVLGIGQVVKGFDVALPQMSVGERAKVRISAEFAYGTEGLPPIIPPNSELVFDITLLGFRPRAAWVKPLIQEPGLSEKPYVVVDGFNNPYLALMNAEHAAED